MPAAYHHLDVEHRVDVWCVRIRSRHLDEAQLSEMTDELAGLVKVEGCRKMALSLGPEPPLFLYSVFLARLVSLQRQLRERGGGLVLCELRPELYRIFEACRLDTQFRFARTVADGCAALEQAAGDNSA
jgi:anti-anti-sigma factor